jgi:hypothetical protein
MPPLRLVTVDAPAARQQDSLTGGAKSVPFPSILTEQPSAPILPWHLEGVLLIDTGSMRSAMQQRPFLNQFTVREQEIFAHVVKGQPNKVIAGLLRISEHTVEQHLQHI